MDGTVEMSFDAMVYIVFIRISYRGAVVKVGGMFIYMGIVS